MRICIIGATGFIGRMTIDYLLKHSSDSIVAFSRSASNINVKDRRLQLHDGSVFDETALTHALKDCDAVIYLFHMMGSRTRDFEAGETTAAKTYVRAAKAAGVRRTVFLGGLGDPNDPALSKHLRSRLATGRLLREHLNGVVELQASMVIGPGSVGFDIIRTISDTLPVIVIPRWAVTRTQPILASDAVRYIADAVRLRGNHNQVIGIGGPEVLTYRDIAARYSKEVAAKRHILRRQPVLTLPGIPHWAAVWWLDRFAPSKAAGIGGPMVDSLRNEMIVRDTEAHHRFPDIHPQRISFQYVLDTKKMDP